MLIQRVALTGLAETLALNESIQVRSPVRVSGRTVFRRVFGLRIPTDGIADGIRVDAGNAHLNATFSPLQLDALAVTPPLASAQPKGVALVVTLEAPMRLRGVRLDVAGSSTEIELYRMDGDALAAEPSRTIFSSSRRSSPRRRGGTARRTGDDIADDFTDARFGLRVAGRNLAPTDLLDVDVTGYPTGPRLGLAPVPASGEPQPTFFWNVPGVVGREANGPSGTADVGALLADALQRHLDGLQPPYPAHVDVLLIAESDAPCRLEVEELEIDAVLLRTSFRAVLLRDEDLRDAPAFLTRLRVASQPLTQHLAGMLAPTSAALLAATPPGAAPVHVLRAVLNDLNRGLQAGPLYAPERFADVALTPETIAAAAAAPTGAARTRLNRRLLTEAFPDAIASFSAVSGATGRLQAQAGTATLNVHIDLARAGIVRSAFLPLSGELRPDAPAATAHDDGTSSIGLHDPIPAGSAVSVDAGRAVAVRIEPSAAIAASGVAIALSPTTAAADVVAELREDQGGTPAGRVLATGTRTTGAVDRPAWLLFTFPAAVLLPARPVWLAVRVRSGAVLWLAPDGTATVRFGDPAAVGWSDRGGARHVAPLWQLWSAAPVATGSRIDTADRIRVQLAGISVQPVQVSGTDRRNADITSALQSFLAAAPPEPAILEVPLTVSAVGTGALTVHPPEIAYDLS